MLTFVFFRTLGKSIRDYVGYAVLARASHSGPKGLEIYRLPKPINYI